VAGNHDGRHIFDEIRSSRWNGWSQFNGGGDGIRHIDFVQVIQGRVHSSIVLLDDRFSTFTVGLPDVVLDAIGGLFRRKDSG